MTNLYRLGDLVKHTIGYDNGISIDIYAKVIGLVHKNTNESFYEFDIITGCGDINSKIIIKVKPICFVNLKRISESKLPIVINLDSLLSLNPHSVFLVNNESSIKSFNRKIDFFNRKIDFLKKHKNRIDKIDEIIN